MKIRNIFGISLLSSILLLSGCSLSKDDSKSAPLTKDEITTYYNGTAGGDNGHDTPFGVGRSVNALTDKYIEVTNRYNPIFNEEKITSIKWVKRNVREQEASVIARDSAIKIQEDLSVQYLNKTYSGVNVNGMFTSGLDKELGVSNELHVNVDTHEIVARLYQNINSYSIEMEGYNDYRNFRDKLSNKLLDDLELLKNGELSPSEFFTFYGTHVVMAGYYGGRIECNYHLMFDDYNITNDTMVNYVDKAGTAIKAFESEAASGKDFEVHVKNYIDVNITSKYETFTFKGRGGKYIAGATEREFMENYSSWIDSFNEGKDGYDVLVDVPDKALMPIWQLFPVGYEEEANLLNETFRDKAQECKKEWINNCTYIFDEDVGGDVVNYAGGLGNEKYPYRIANEKHLLNIALHMDAYYKLINDVDISGVMNWEPIGGNYLENAFTGHLDGKGYSIIGLTRTNDIQEVKGKSYFGLFGFIGEGGVVENIEFKDVNISITGPKGKDSVRQFFGIVAGKCMGTISNIITRGLLSYEFRTNGETHAGGFVGYAVNALISHSENYATIYVERNASSAGGFVGYSQGGRIEYCKNDASVWTKGTDDNGFAKASLVGGTSHKTYPTVLLSNETSGTLKAEAFNSHLINNITIKMSETDFADYKDETY